jgi:hypothetical protein
MYKFCIISFVSGTRGAYLGYQLYSRYPELFSVQKVYDNKPIDNNHWHIFEPHFSEEIFRCHPNLILSKLFDSKAAQLLDKTKYNIILTHCYQDEELAPIYEALANHEVKTLQISFFEDDKESIMDRVLDIFPTFKIKTEEDFILFFNSILDSNCGYQASGSIPIKLSELKDEKDPINLGNILQYFKL